MTSDQHKYKLRATILIPNVWIPFLSNNIETKSVSMNIFRKNIFF